MNKLSAIYDTREYFFTVKSKSAERVEIVVYGGEYTLVKSAKGWENAASNTNNMVQGLIDSITLTIGT